MDLPNVRMTVVEVIYVVIIIDVRRRRRFARLLGQGLGDC